jgi:hypothetical protein
MAGFLKEFPDAKGIETVGQCHILFHVVRWKEFPDAKGTLKNREIGSSGDLKGELMLRVPRNSVSGVG